jgi:hypothetical protein
MQSYDKMMHDMHGLKKIVKYIKKIFPLEFSIQYNQSRENVYLFFTFQNLIFFGMLHLLR